MGSSPGDDRHFGPETPLPVLAGQVLVAGFPGVSLPDVLSQASSSGQLGGIILFKRNLTGVGLEALEDLARLIAGFLGTATMPPLVSVDQEGGRVARLGPPILALPPMAELGATFDSELCRRTGRVLGEQLRAVGFNCDFAPVLDIDTNPSNPIIGDRAFGRTAEAVIETALAFGDGLLEAGVIPCGKHFPGHGDTDVDSHLALPRLSHDRRRLDQVELAPFRAARGRLPMLMTAHISFDAIDPDVPATMSHAVLTDLLRGELAYDGVIVSDDLEMGAVRQRMSIPEAACDAIAAGCDALLICSDVDEVGRARAALAARAARDGAFRERLRDAANRFLRVRAIHPPAAHGTVGATLHAALRPEVAMGLEREIAARVLADAASSRPRT